MAEVAAHHEVHLNQVTAGRASCLRTRRGLSARKRCSDGKKCIRELYEKTGELTVERDFLSGALGKFRGPSGKRWSNGVGS